MFVSEPSDLCKNLYPIAYITVGAKFLFLLFYYLLKWPICNTRFHLGFLVLMSPFVGIIIILSPVTCYLSPVIVDFLILMKIAIVHQLAKIPNKFSLKERLILYH